MTTFSNAVKIAAGALKNRIVLNEITELYHPAIKKHKNKLKELINEKIEQASKSGVARKAQIIKGYYTLEMAPPNLDEIQKLKSDLALVKEFIGTGCYKYLTVRQAFLLLLVATEIGMWFYLGETIGKMHIVGYQV